MVKIAQQKKILFIAIPNSIHTARWLSQFADFEDYELHVFPSTPFEWHKHILENKKLILHQFTYPQGYDYNCLTDEILDVISLEIEKIIQNINPQIVHTLEMQHAGYLVLPLKLRYKDNFPLWFYSCWGSDIRYFENIQEHKGKIIKVLNNCDALFSDDKFSIERAKIKYGYKKATIKVPSPGGLKVKYYENLINREETSERKIIIVKGYCGWVYKLDILVEALLLCKKELIDNDYTVKIYIPPADNKYIDELKNAGIKVGIFNYTQNYDEVIKFYSTARINLASSLSDGVPNSMLEGMLAGVFPIQSNSGAAAEYIEHGKNGILLDPLDVKGYANAIKIAIKDNELVDNAAALNKKIIKERLDYDIIKNKVLHFYNSFLNIKEYVH